MTLDLRTLFTYDANGNIISVINSSSGIHYKYDLFGNMIEVNFFDGSSEQYSYDSRGKRIKKKGKAGDTTYYAFNEESVQFERNIKKIVVGNIIAEARELACFTDGAAPEQTIIPDEKAGLSTLSTLDVVSLLDFVVNKTAEPEELSIADVNNDLKVSLEDVESISNTLLSSTRPGGTYVRTVIADTAYLKVSGIMIMSVKNGDLSYPTYYLTDHLGSSSVVLNSTGTEIGRQEYYPFGSTLKVTGAVPQVSVHWKGKRLFNRSVLLQIQDTTTRR